MKRNILYGIVNSVGMYIFIVLITLLINQELNLELIKMIGFGASLVLFLSAFPLYKTLYHGGRVANSAYIAYTPPDEHHQQKIQRDYENTQKKRKSSLGGILVWTAFLTLIITIILTVLF